MSGSERFINIHHYYTENGKDTYDDDGEPLLGFYFQVMDSVDVAHDAAVGPYGTFELAEEAARQAASCLS